MENKQKALFEYQRFEKNPRLAALISETENRYKKELKDEDLYYVNAAQGIISASQMIEPEMPDFEQK